MGFKTDISVGYANITSLTTFPLHSQSRETPEVVLNFTYYRSEKNSHDDVKEFTNTRLFDRTVVLPITPDVHDLMKWLMYRAVKSNTKAIEELPDLQGDDMDSVNDVAKTPQKILGLLTDEERQLLKEALL